MSHISFEHFDPELELGNLDENGRPIRPRKKPGRKPNPPSPAQRKAQNRAAQRAFRERKRREMREAESTVKRSLHARDEALHQVRRLKRRVEELEFETNYLKGYTLTLKMACVANKVEVPKFWDTGATDEVGADELTFSRTKGIPQQLEFFLDNKLNIISIEQHHLKQQQQQQQHGSYPKDTMSDNELPPSSILSTSSPISSYLVVDEEQEEQHLVSSPVSSTSSLSSSSGESNNDFDSISSQCSNSSHHHHHRQQQSTTTDFDALSSIAPELAHHLETPFFQQLLNTDLVGSHLQQPCATYNASRQESFPIHPSTPAAALFPPEAELPEGKEEEDEQDKLFDAKTGLERTLTEHPANGTDNTSDEASTYSFNTNASSSSSSGDKKKFPPMTPLDAIEKMRAVKHLNATTRALFTPTELQRTIRHDTRIDVIPGAALRDHMILFQDFYNANELFDYLAESSVFLGGELGNPDSWFVPQSFFKRYWFLCPNHKRHRMDNVVDVMVKLGKRLVDLMSQRKQMYLEREQYAEFFPEPTKELQQVVDNEFMQRDDQQHLDDIYQHDTLGLFMHEEEQEQEHDDDMLDHHEEALSPPSNINLLSSDLPLDQFMAMIHPHPSFTA